jgi:hypothetical protein
MAAKRFDSRGGFARTLVVLGVSALLAGCAAQSGSGSAATSVAPSAAAPATVAPTAAPSSAPSSSPAAEANPSAGAALALCAMTPEPCPLVAGTYSTQPFVFPYLFTIDAEWTNDRAWPHGGEIYLPTGAVQWASGVTKGSRDGTQLTIGQTPADFVDFLRKQKGFTVSQPTPVTIGGVAGQSVDLLTNEIRERGIYMIAEDVANVDPGEKIRFFLVPMSDDMVIMTIDAFKAAGFDDFAAQAQPVIDSIEWQPVP